MACGGLRGGSGLAVVTRGSAGLEVVWKVSGLPRDCLASFSCSIASLCSGVNTILLISRPSNLSKISLLSPAVRMMFRPCPPGEGGLVGPGPATRLGNLLDPGAASRLGNLSGRGAATRLGNLSGSGVPPRLGNLSGSGAPTLGGSLVGVCPKLVKGLLFLGGAGAGDGEVGGGPRGGDGGGGVLGSGSLTSWNSPKVASGTASILGKSLASMVRDLMLLSRGAKGVCWYEEWGWCSSSSSNTISAMLHP